MPKPASTRSAYKMLTCIYLCRTLLFFAPYADFFLKKVAIASPFRVYYQFRNYLWLCRRDYVPRYWKRKNGMKYFVKLFYFPICVAPRTMYLRRIVRGVISGLNPVKPNWPIFLMLSSLLRMFKEG